VQDLRIAIVGDVHGLWDRGDRDALHELGIDIVLFVGDLGNEAVEIVREVAAIELPKAVILGNHDAFYSATRKGIDNCPYDRKVEDRLQQQLDLLGETHVGYGKLEFPEWNLSIIGGRPFSSGGADWSHRRFYRERYGIHNLKESTQKIIETIDSAQGDRRILISHNGPAGLGSQPHDLCGKDWEPVGGEDGDHGDLDLQAALEQTQFRKPLNLVTFGHMHHHLRHGRGLRKRWLETSTTHYLNAACVPRQIQTDQGLHRLFSIVTLTGSKIINPTIVRLNEKHQVIDRDPLDQP
jgi:uncharacterized protein (TIGR04168 family)